VVCGETTEYPGVTCYGDSVNGDDNNSGLSEDDPVKTQDGIPSDCEVIRFKGGSVFNEALNTGGFGRSGAKVFTNYGDLNDPLPRFQMERVPSNGSIV
jgi:hypothetical protein